MVNKGSKLWRQAAAFWQRLSAIPLRLVAVLLTVLAIFVIHALPDSTRKLHFNSNNEYSLFASAEESGASATWLDDYSFSRFKCDLAADLASWCGLSMGWPGEPDGLMDFTGFHSLKINLKYVGPAKRIRIYLRTYNEAFGDLDEPDKNKFQSTVVDTAEFESTVTIPLSDFIVADWWVQRYQVDRQYTQPDFSQVFALAIDFPQPGAAGEHVMHVQNISLVGDYLAKETAYLTLLVMWMLALSIEGFYRYYQMSSRFHTVQAKALSLANYARELRVESSKYKKLSAIDPLTQVFNRSGARLVIAEHFEHLPLGARGVLLILDIDHFKRINDNYGHSTGDEVIARVAACLKKHVASRDVVVRWGGEEFLVLCPQCDYIEGRKIAERLRIAVANTSGPLGPRNIAVTVSVGATVLSATDDFNSAFERADRHLYRAKRSGRNCVVYDPKPRGLITSLKAEKSYV